ncbi:MAG: adenosylcobinamide-GDP ribazoletransferase [Nitrospirota bacterium]
MRQVLIAFQFLTLIPFRLKGDFSEKEISKSAAFFPVVGAFQGLLALLSAGLLLNIFPLDVVIGLIVLILIASNGGFHIDGLADTFDALAVKSSGNKRTDRQKRLAVMKDSATGAIGATALVFAILLKFVLLKNLFSDSNLVTACLLLFLMPVFSKWAMIPAIFHGRAAKQDGLGKIFIENTGFKELLIASIFMVGFLLIAIYISSLSDYFIFLLFSLCVFYILSFLMIKFFENKFGGLTGDTLGTINEITEIIFLLMVTGWLRIYT